MAEERKDTNHQMPPGLGRKWHGARHAPVVKPKDFKGTMRRVLKYFSQEYMRLACVFLLILCGIGATLLPPAIIGRATDAIITNDQQSLVICCIIIGVLYLANMLIHLCQGFLLAGVSQRVVLRIRKELFEKLQNFPLIFFDTRSHGDLMSRFSNDVDNISGTISQAVVQIITTALMLIGSVSLMLAASPALTAACFVVIPLFFILTKVITTKTRPMFKAQQAALGALNGHVEESIGGVKVVQAFNKQDDEIKRFEKTNDNMTKIAIKAQIISGFMMPMMEVINNLTFVIITLAGGYLVVQNAITVGVIVTFVGYTRYYTRPLNELANMLNVLQSAVASAERVFEILDHPEEQPDAADASKLAEPAGRIRFSDVSFGYNPNTPVLKDVSFEIEAGDTIALVGTTGAGKTTLVNLLTRFYEIDSGKIYIDGTDIREYTKGSLRRSFGIVLQDTYLFSGTIKDNILYGKPNATEDELVTAAKIADADTFIQQLPNGYDTLLAESGSNLSQGQRQLLAIARAVLSDPPLLILDEATSNVDTRTEIRIQNSFKKLMEGKTSFIIAHRLSTIRNCRTIMVIEHGQIVERGSHDELMERRGVYAKMYNSQFM